MELKEIFALVDYLVDEKLSEINLPQGKKGLRGPRGRDGEDFNWDSSKDKIEKYVIENALTFEKLTEEQILSLKGEKGFRGQRGKIGEKGQDGLDGKDFVWDEHIDKISNLISLNKLKFSDLSDEEKESLKGRDGLRGQKGSRGVDGLDGSDFVWAEHEDKIFSEINKNKLTFAKLTDDEKLSLRGPRGLRGQKGKIGEVGESGKDFSWEENESKIFDRIDSNKLEFLNLTDEEKESIKGDRGARGQKGKSGSNGLSAFEIWLKENNGEEKDFVKSLVGKTGIPGLQGVQGFSGKNGINGFNGHDGIDGEDAPYIIDIQLKDIRGGFYFVFFFSDGTRFETKTVQKPAIESIIQNTYIKTGGSGGGASVLEVYKDSILAGLSTSLNFIGDNIVVDYDPITEQSTISVLENDTCIPVSDEGSEITDCLKSIDFCGEGVVVTSSTFMSDWTTLSDVTTLAGYEAVNPGATKVTINGQSAKLGMTRLASEAIQKFDLVRLINSTQVAKGSSDSELESKISGIALNSAAIGEDLTFIMFGILEDASFNFTLLAKLFLQSDGSLGETPPSSIGDFVVVSAQSLGAGAVFIKIEEPEEVT